MNKCVRCEKEINGWYWTDGKEKLCCECRDFIKGLSDELRAKHPDLFKHN